MKTRNNLKVYHYSVNIGKGSLEELFLEERKFKGTNFG